MKITRIAISNFRLLEDVELCLEDTTTLIVGRNNSGKTSITELFRRLLDEKGPRFRLEDFSLGVHEKFWSAFELHRSNIEEVDIRLALPIISTIVMIEYGRTESLGPLSNFVIDLDDSCTVAQINIQYALAPGKIKQLFADLDADRIAFFRALKERIPRFFKATFEAQDPNDPTNRKPVEAVNLRAVLQFGFINAQRALDNTTNKETAILGKVFERLFAAASAETASTGEQDTASSLKSAVESIQNQINEDFNSQLISLAPTFDLFGYPGLSDPQLRTETILKVEQLLSNHTTVGYLGANGVNLPESYNGLGPRNLIFILLKLFEFFKEFTNRQSASGIHLIFIEEPEAHLHPQMQSVFIRKLDEIRKLFSTRYNDENLWPVQFVVTTHSSHIANEATFDSMRYFLAERRQAESLIYKTVVKDLRIGLSDEEKPNRDFLHKYMTLTRCDLLFADKAILIEGTTERLLLPEMIRKHDDGGGGAQTAAKLSNQYYSIMEVGGAYAHIFFNLLDFLNLRTLIITDLDTVNSENDRRKCKVSEGTHSSNACINNWFKTNADDNPTKDELLAKTEDEKIIENRRLAFQIPHIDGGACGRSLEDAFVLANTSKFGIAGTNPVEREEQAWDLAKRFDKTEFALKYAILDTAWETPRFIEEGLQWLAAANTVSAADDGADIGASTTVEEGDANA